MIQTPADGVPDPGEARHDRRLERGIDKISRTHRIARAPSSVDSSPAAA